MSEQDYRTEQDIKLVERALILMRGIADESERLAGVEELFTYNLVNEVGLRLRGIEKDEKSKVTELAIELIAAVAWAQRDPNAASLAPKIEDYLQTELARPIRLYMTKVGERDALDIVGVNSVLYLPISSLTDELDTESTLEASVSLLKSMISRAEDAYHQAIKNLRSPKVASYFAKSDGPFEIFVIHDGEPLERHSADELVALNDFLLHNLRSHRALLFDRTNKYTCNVLLYQGTDGVYLPDKAYGFGRNRAKSLMLQVSDALLKNGSGGRVIFPDANQGDGSESTKARSEISEALSDFSIRASLSLDSSKAGIGERRFEFSHSIPIVIVKKA